jgi:transposase
VSEAFFSVVSRWAGSIAPIAAPGVRGPVSERGEGNLRVGAPKKYPNELRQRAVALYLETKPRPAIRRLAEQVGVHPEALRNWIRKAESERSRRDERLVNPEAHELCQLRKEIADLRRANEILKAANAFLTAQTDSTNLRA